MATNNQGYGVTWSSGKVVLAHRLSWQQRNGEIPSGMCVLHRCDTPLCVNPDHLFLGTKKDNTNDMKAKGRASNGVRILTADTVREIRAICKSGKFTSSEIGGRFGISQQAASDVISGRAWRNV